VIRLTVNHQINVAIEGRLSGLNKAEKTKFFPMSSDAPAHNVFLRPGETEIYHSGSPGTLVWERVGILVSHTTGGGGCQVFNPLLRAVPANPLFALLRP
jgi:hypothetical protein